MIFLKDHMWSYAVNLKCADCGCLPSECLVAATPKDCPHCTWSECCCWKYIIKSQDRQ